jgi:uncharacterized protein YcaQ
MVMTEDLFEAAPARPSRLPDPLTITRDEARLLAVAAQGLDRRPRGKVTKDRILATIRRLGSVQLDTISVVARSHETVLWSRLGPYDPALVAELHHPDGALFEYWAHAAAILPIESFPLFRRNMARYTGADSPYRAWMEEHAETVEHVLATIRAHGPVMTRDFDRPDGPRPDPWTWYGGKPAKQALDLLWTSGRLMILRREGFERVYDLTERVLPGAHEAPLPSPEEQRRAFVTQSLRALGVATPRATADYFRTGGRWHVPPKEAAAELAALAAEGQAVPLALDGLGEPAWLDAGLLPHLEELRAGRAKPTLTTLLSPFDNLTWHRRRAAALFGFDYRLECYVPAAKRRYGYYSLSILHRGKLVGRLDPVYRRKERRLTVKAVHLEPGVRPTAPLAAAVAASLRDYLTFLGGDEIEVLESDPPAFAKLLRASIES